MAKLKMKHFSCESTYLVTFFNLHYYLCLVPFKTEFAGRETENYDDKSRVYFLKHNSIQRILCGFSNLGTLMLMFYGVVEEASHFKSGDPSIISLIFYWIGDSGSLLCAISFFHFTWWKQEQYLELVEKTKVPVSLRMRKIIQWMACLY